MPHAPSPCSHSRRSFLGSCLSCGSYVAFSLAAGGATARAAMGAADTTARGAAELDVETSFARVARLFDDVWSVVSTPSEGNYQTVSNGGFIRGRDLTVAIEGFNDPAGGAWASTVCAELTGRAPDLVIVTHLHGDHTNGLAGYLRGAHPPQIVSTATTRRIQGERAAAATADGADERTGLAAHGGSTVLADLIVPEDGATEIDLGGLTLRLTPRGGHSPSDLEIRVVERNVVWTGDLVFNGLFPYYGDATPSKLRAACATMLDDRDATFVPGHGPVADHAGLRPYVALLDHVEAAARRFHEQGVSADEAWQRYVIPESMGEWAKFRPDVYRFAFEAWESELRGTE